MIFIEVIEGSKMNSNHQNTTRDNRGANTVHDNLALLSERLVISQLFRFSQLIQFYRFQNSNKVTYGLRNSKPETQTTLTQPH